MILSCQNISKSFGTDEILKNIFVDKLKQDGKSR